MYKPPLGYKPLRLQALLKTIRKFVSKLSFMVSRNDYIAVKIYFQVPHQAKAAMILALYKGVPFHFILSLCYSMQFTKTTTIKLY